MKHDDFFQVCKRVLIRLRRGPARFTDLTKIISRKQFEKVIPYLVNKGLVAKVETVGRKYYCLPKDLDATVEMVTRRTIRTPTRELRRRLRIVREM